MLSTTVACDGHAQDKSAALITDGHVDGATRDGICVDHGGPIGHFKDGDVIITDAITGARNIDLSAATVAKRRKTLKPQAKPNQSIVQRKFADQAGPARQSAVTHAGGKAEVVC